MYPVVIFPCAVCSGQELEAARQQSHRDHEELRDLRNPWLCVPCCHIPVCCVFRSGAGGCPPAITPGDHEELRDLRNPWLCVPCCHIPVCCVFRSGAGGCPPAITPRPRGAEGPEGPLAVCTLLSYSRVLCVPARSWRLPASNHTETTRS